MSGYKIPPSSVEIHADATILPSMTDEEYRSLVEDIRKYGQLVPATICQGKLLDGRHRMRACAELGIDLLVEDAGDSDIDTVAMAYSLNAKRRNLLPGQLAALGSDLANLKWGTNRYTEKVEILNRNSKNEDNEKAYTQAEAAVIVGTNQQRISEFRKVDRLNPELAAKVRSGDIGIQDAYKKVSAKEKKREKAKKEAPPKLKILNESFDQWASRLSKREKKILDKHLSDVDFAARKQEREHSAGLIENLHNDRMEIAAQQAQLRESRMMLRSPLDYDEFKLIRGMLHPDKHPGNEARAQRAFDAFSRLELICKRAAA